MGKLAKSLAISAKPRVAMTDVQFAADLMQEAFPVRTGRNVTSAIGEIFEALQRHERTLPREVIRERQRQWTERRVRALWKHEARRVDHYEIQDLTAVAVEEARRERQYLEARQERVDAILAFANASELGEVEFSASKQVRGLDLSGIGFTDADDRADQSRGWAK